MNYKELLEFNDYAMDLTIRMAHHTPLLKTILWALLKP